MTRKKKSRRSRNYRTRVAVKIVKWRKAAGYKTQWQMAEALGCHKNIVGLWERAETMPSPESLVDLARLVGAESVEQMLTEAPSE